MDQLLSGAGGRFRDTVDDDCVLVPHQGDPAESSYQVRLTVTVDPGFEAGPQPVLRLDRGLVFRGHLRHSGLVLGGQVLQLRILSGVVSADFRTGRSTQPISGFTGRRVFLSMGFGLTRRDAGCAELAAMPGP